MFIVRAFFFAAILPFGLAACQSSQTAVSSYAGNQLGTSSRAGISESPIFSTTARFAKPDRVTTPRLAARTTNPATNPGGVVADREGTQSSLFAALPENRAATSKRKSAAMARPKPELRKKRRRGKAGTRAQYRNLIAKHARANGVPVKLAMAVVQVESNYRANARGRAGEIGLMQIMPRTARGIGYKGPMKKLYNPDTNIRYGMKYLGKAYKLGGGTTCGAILKYNAGHYAKRMNPISRKYCKRVSRIMRQS